MNRTEVMKTFAMEQFEQYVDVIPMHCRDGLRLYLTDGIEPGGFLLAVLCNDFKGAAARADHLNRYSLKEYAIFMSNGMPNSAQGSPQKVQEWIDHRGFKGLLEASEEAEAENL